LLRSIHKIGAIKTTICASETVQTRKARILAAHERLHCALKIDTDPSRPYQQKPQSQTLELPYKLPDDNLQRKKLITKVLRQMFIENRKGYKNSKK